MLVRIMLLMLVRLLLVLLRILLVRVLRVLLWLLRVLVRVIRIPLPKLARLLLVGIRLLAAVLLVPTTVLLGGLIAWGGAVTVVPPPTPVERVIGVPRFGAGTPAIISHRSPCDAQRQFVVRPGRAFEP
jgi:hypothetical protein